MDEARKIESDNSSNVEIKLNELGEIQNTKLYGANSKAGTASETIENTEHLAILTDLVCR